MTEAFLTSVESVVSSQSNALEKRVGCEMQCEREAICKSDASDLSLGVTGGERESELISPTKITGWLLDMTMSVISEEKESVCSMV